MARMIVCLFATVALGIALSGCPGEGKKFSGETGDLTTPEDALSDGGVPGVDTRSVDGEAPDWIPGMDTPGDLPSDVPGDDTSDLIFDGGAEDLGSDMGPEVVEPGEPWAPCSQQAPCVGDAEICLLLPGDEAMGICVLPCAPGAGDCAPSMDCVVPDPDSAPDTGFCFLPAGHLEPCDAAVGRVCSDGRSCLAPLTGGDAVCTDFCVQDEALCPDLTSCQPVTEEGAAEGWGACLPVAAPFPCSGPAGAACPGGGTCTESEAPDGPPLICLHLQGASELCDAPKGWACKDGLACVDVTDPTGFGRCATPCGTSVDCLPHEVCVVGTDADGGVALGCLPPSLAGPALPACNDAFPCEAPDACVEGACVAPCDGDCPDGQGCVDGGCVHLSTSGKACAPGWGWLCADEAVCATDTKAESGICTSACGGDGDCPPGDACLPGPDGASLCLLPVDFGGACAFSLGTACAGDGHCMFLGSGAAGFCTAACPGIGQGGCPEGPAGTLSDCMLNSGGQSWCAFLCGPFGSDCPDGMNCDVSGVCLP